MIAVFTAMLATAAPAAASPASPLAVRFCPAAVARTYPLMDAARIHGLVVHNVAVINRGDRPATLKSIALELLDKGQVVDTRRFEGAALDAAAQAAVRT